jgi:hypothetical protein
MQAAESATTFAPAITWLNMSGDVTITWDDANRDAIKALIIEKMAQKYSFFIITPRFFPIFGNKQVKLTDPKQLENALGVVVPDSQLSEIAGQLGSVGDADLDTALRSGNAQLATAPKTKLEMTRRATTADEVLQHQSVAIRPITGG